MLKDSVHSQLPTRIQYKIIIIITTMEEFIQIFCMVQRESKLISQLISQR